MNTKIFFNEMRKIIREEVQLAVRQILAESVITTESAPSKPAKVAHPPVIVNNPTLQELLNETALSSRNRVDNETFNFNASDARSFGYGNETRGREATPSTVEIDGRLIPAEAVGEAVVNALTKDYSSLMKAMDKVKDKKRP